MRLALTLAYLIACGIVVWAVKSWPTTETVAVLASDAAPTQVIHVVLEHPTGTATMIPTLEPTKDDVTPTLNLCSTPTAGQVCQMPPVPTRKPTPYPACPAKPNEWCVWPTESP